MMKKMRINFYITGNVDENIIESFKRKEYLNIHFGRINLEKAVSQSQAVAVCGSNDITKIVEQLSRKHGKRCFTETF
jgi:hypothetical protein